MSKDDKKDPKKNINKERILDQFPEDLLPGYTPDQIDVLKDSFSDIIKASGVRSVVEKMVKDPKQRNAANVFLDALIEKNSAYFDSIRESLKDDTLRRKLILEMAKRSKT